MKQYLLLLRSSDFNKSNNIWTTNPINVYNNDTYKNYSYMRSLYGLDLIGDRTFVGTEVTSPSYSLSAAAPIDDNAVYVTNYGEVIYDSATPDLLRFIDTTSRVDILSYKHAFTNIPGTFQPTFNLQLYESDTGEVNGPWLKSSISRDSNVLFIRNVKKYIKIELEVYAEEIDINSLGLVFYLEVGIHHANSPVISSSSKNILRRFPSWTAMYEDSVDSATPRLQIPQSTAGKFLSSLLQESLDDFQGDIDEVSINSYINSADTNMLSWVYSTNDILSNIVSVQGDGVELAKSEGIVNFFDSRQTDYIYNYNPISKEILTTRLFGELLINGKKYDQDPKLIFNDFDEFGARVSLPRLYLESNDNYKKRILDVTANLPEITMEGFKRTLRRELDIWRAYGSTPDSNYLGATPEVLEISDIESSTQYFDYSGKPLPAFEKLVEDINSRYPSNLGYVKWGEGVWDYAGTLNEGVGRIPAIYDVGYDDNGKIFRSSYHILGFDGQFVSKNKIIVSLSNSNSESIIYSVATDVTGGTYIGGNFDKVNDQERKSIAYINTSGSLSSFSLNVVGTIRTLKLHGDNIYLGGNFTEINSMTRSGLAAINTSGYLLSWNPIVNETIYELEISQNNIYFIGNFTSVNGVERNGLAAVNTAGVLLDWDPNPGGTTNTIEISGSNIYVGGHISSIGGKRAHKAVVVNTAGNTLYTTTSITSDVLLPEIFTSVEDGSGGFYFGGNFTSINGVNRNYLAHINSSGQLSSWNPSASDSIYAIEISGSNVYFAGNFTSINGNVRSKIAAVNTSGNVLSWNPSASGSIRAIKIIGQNIYLGGQGFSGIAGSNRENFAVINTAGTLLSTSLNFGYYGILTMGVIGDDIYLGGAFNSVSGNARYGLAAINTSGSLLNWNPSAEGIVRSIGIIGDNVYIGGDFTSINGNTRYGIAAINTSGNVLSWNPGIGSVYAIATFGTNVYIGGSFEKVFGQPRNNLAVINTVGSLLSLDYKLDDYVLTLSVFGENIFIGGKFDRVQFEKRNFIAAVNTSGNVLAWDPNVNGNVWALGISGNNVYIGGQFTSVNGNIRNRLAAVNTSGSLLHWNPSASSSICALAISGDNIYVGGAFSLIGGISRSHLASINTLGNILEWNPIANDGMRSLTINGDNIYITGNNFNIITQAPIEFKKNYKAGVGDFSDGKLLVQQLEEATVSFDGTIKIHGVEKAGEENFYTPIDIHYSWYLSYLQKVNDYHAGRRVEGIEEDVGVAVVYEIDMPPHDNYATPSTFYSNLTYLERDDFFVGNRYSQNHSSYPEFNYIKIVDQEGNTLNDIEFRSKEFDELYLNTEATPYSRSINIYKADRVRVLFNATWNNLFYQEEQVAPYRIKFDDDTLSYLDNPVTAEFMEIITPDVNYYSANLKIGSTVYSEVSQLFNSSQASSSIRINDLNDPTVNGVSSKIIDVQDLLDSIIYPVAATPQMLYINTAYYDDYPIFDADEILSARGGISDNIIDESTYLVPASPNITWTLYRESDDQVVSPAEYFEAATINDFATPFYIEVNSANSTYYPFKKSYYDKFTAETNTEFFYGFIDEINNTYKEASEVENYYINQDKYLDSFLIDKSSFGLDENTEYVVSSIEIATTPQFVKAYFPDADAVLKSVSDAIQNNEKATVDIYAERDELTDAYYLTGLHSGWVYVDEKEYYIYSKPATETYNGQYFNIELQDVPRIGAPILVEVGSQEYRNIVFEDAATPGKISFINTESVMGNKSNTLYLAYEDLSEIQVKDTYTGSIIFSDLTTSTNEISPFTSSTPAVYGREYEITYRVNDSFYVDKDVYFDQIDEYKPVLYLSATPSVSSEYTITYEKDSINNFMSIDLNIDQADNPLNEGYVYISKDEYNFSDIRTTLSPTFIGDSYDDFMSLSVISYDTNGNLKPGQTFRIHGSYIAATPEYVTTNDNGFGVSIIKYDGPRPSNVKYDSIDIEGIGSATPNGSFNSLTGGFNLQIPFKIRRSNEFNADLKAAPIRYRIPADGVTDVPIVGRVYWKDQPFEAEVSLKWNKAETLYDLFNLEEFNYFTTDSQGKFLIQNQITAQNSLNPSGWFVRIEIADEGEFFNQLEAAGEVLSPLDVTISGDIVYWHEEYDSIHYANEQLPMSTRFGYNIEPDSDYLASPTFIYDHPTSSRALIYPSTTPFYIPRWVNLRRYDQYQMGILGSNVDDIDNYNNIHPDFGDA